MSVSTNSVANILPSHRNRALSGVFSIMYDGKSRSGVFYIIYWSVMLRDPALELSLFPAIAQSHDWRAGTLIWSPPLKVMPLECVLVYTERSRPHSVRLSLEDRQRLPKVTSNYHT